MRRRSRIELYIDTLKAVANGRNSPSRVVHSANIPYDRVVRYLEFLREQGLVKKEGGKKKRFTITDRGLDIIRCFDKVKADLFYRTKTIANVKIHFKKRTHKIRALHS